MKKQKPQKNVTFLGIVILILLLSAVAWFVSSPKKEPESTVTKSSEVEHFTSENLEISFDAKTPVLMKDLWTNVVLDYDGKEIVIGRSGSDYQSLREYLDHLIEINHLDAISQEEITIDDSPGIILFTHTTDGDYPTYYVIKDGWVFSLFTVHPELFDDLDMVAKTFRYHPEN
ncbi:hypothetical protein IPM65_05020 [Candidatus Roizmanbacteria bacterium]|nr:MAG: hypothetical protein IPM65_05020 [Candidatus Roizmanbacteria bacterium]